MKMYVFQSQSNDELRAFAADLKGSRLPARHGPWKAVGSIAPNRAPPHALPRDRIEASIQGEGFQLWRIRTKKKKQEASTARRRRS